jgi:glycosyltransferase involved in cell wall biosynthesis
MNVMMIEPLGDGGITHYTFNLASALVKQGADVILFTNRNYEFSGEVSCFKVYSRMFSIAHLLIKVFPSVDKETGFQSHLRRIIKLVEYPINTIEALMIAKREKRDVVHFQSVNETELFMVLLFVILGFKVFFTVHNVMPRHGRLRGYQAVLYRVMYKLCDHMIIHTHEGKGEIRSLFDVEPQKISVIPHGDYKFFVPEESLTKEESKESLGIGNDCRTILFFGAIRPNKGLDTILRAYPLIRRTLPGVTLMIVGEPCEDYGRYRRIMAKEGIQGGVLEELEYVRNEEIAVYFNAADVVVLPYYEVTGSGVLQVAYAFGKAVVATALAGFSEVVEEGRNGFLVPPGDREVLAMKIVEILRDQEKIENMGKYSRFLCDTKYSWDSIADRTLGLYTGP